MFFFLFLLGKPITIILFVFCFFRGCKNTLWQGGVRGVGFVHSPLLQNKGYINEKLMHVTDWMPTFLSLAQKKSSQLTNLNSKPDSQLNNPKSIEGLDGFDQWEVISQNTKAKRQEVLLNIDPIDKTGAIIMGDFKLIYGETSTTAHFSGWYPPAGHKSNSNDDAKAFQTETRLEKKSSHEIILSKMENLSIKLDADVSPLLSLINKQYESLRKDLFPNSPSRKPSQLYFSSETENVKSSSQTQNSQKGDITVTVDCGPKPQNASTNCNLGKEACLYNLSDDPCEYFNLASAFPKIVDFLKARLQVYHDSMLPPANKPIDPKGNPQLNGGVWKPWLK